MIEGKYYLCIESNQYVEEGEFYKLLRNAGTQVSEYEIPGLPNGGRWVHNSRFDLTTPYDSPPKKENTMIEGKWYKCVESGSGVEAGKYYQCTEANTGGRGGNVYSQWDYHRRAFNCRFDPTPHDRTVFPNAPDLLERVRRIDPAAAEWLEFGDHPKVCDFDAGRCNLEDMMVWRSTPHGHNYWERIHDAVDYEKEEQPVTKDDFKKGDRVEVRDEDDEDWEPATFLCMDEESAFKYVAKPFGVADGFRYCRRAAPKRPHIEPGTPIEVWDDAGEKPAVRRFSKWISGSGPYIVSTGDVGWKHCRVLVPNGVAV